MFKCCLWIYNKSLPRFLFVEDSINTYFDFSVDQTLCISSGHFHYIFSWARAGIWNVLEFSITLENNGYTESQEPLAQRNQVGVGKRQPRTFHSGECRRKFSDAVLCKSTFQMSPLALAEIGEAVKTIIRVEITKVLELRKGVNLWVVIKTVDDNQLTVWTITSSRLFSFDTCFYY